VHTDLAGRDLPFFEVHLFLGKGDDFFGPVALSTGVAVAIWTRFVAGGVYRGLFGSG
jgi:hypothetical protein